MKKQDNLGILMIATEWQFSLPILSPSTVQTKVSLLAGTIRLETDCPAPEDARDITAALTGDGEGYRRLVMRYQQEIAQQMLRFSRDPSIRDELVHVSLSKRT